MVAVRRQQEGMHAQAAVTPGKGREGEGREGKKVSQACHKQRMIQGHVWPPPAALELSLPLLPPLHRQWWEEASVLWAVEGGRSVCVKFLKR